MNEKTKPAAAIESENTLQDSAMQDIHIRDVNPANQIRQTPTEITPMVMMQMAIAEGSDVATMERLWALNEKVEAANAKKSYDFAMAKFKADPPEIYKDKTVTYETDKGITTYDHATLGNSNEQIVLKLAPHGLSHKWEISQPEGDQIFVKCVITHEGGHSESVQLNSSRDASGGKNNIQSLASTVAYLERYTLLAATGMAAMDMDDDGRGAGEPPVLPISEAQANKIYSMLDENKLDKEIFLGWIGRLIPGIQTVEAIPVTFFDRAIKKIETTIKAKNKNEQG